MIKNIFSAVANMSITGAYIILAVLVIRAAIKRLPKRFSYMLWAIPAVRLLCPFTIPSAASLFNLINPAHAEKRIAKTTEAVSRAMPVFNVQPAEYIPPETAAVYYTMPNRQTAASAGFKPDIGEIAAWIWLAVAAGIVVYCAVCYVKMYTTLAYALRCESGDYYISPKIESPLVFGFIRPKIYLTKGLSETDCRCILAHEQAHIRRHDHIVKLLCIPIIAIHWFNPLVWIGINRMQRDMELSCDEAALGVLGSKSKKAYAEALLNMALKQNRISLCGALCFGEKNIKARIKGVLSMKKPKIIAIVAAVAVVAVSAVSLLTSALPEKQLTLGEIMLTSPDAKSIPDVSYDKAVSFAGAEENVCLSYKICKNYRFKLIAEKAFKDSEKSSNSIYVSKLKIIGKLPGGEYYEQELPGENLTLKSSKIESYLTTRIMDKPLLVFNSPSDYTVYIYTVTAEDGFVQMGEPITFEESPDAYRSLCSYLSWDSYKNMMYDSESNIRYDFDFRKFTYKITYDYLDVEDVITQYIQAQVMGKVVSADIVEIAPQYDIYELAWYYDDNDNYVNLGKIYKGIYNLNHFDNTVETKNDFFIVHQSSLGARIDKVVANNITTRVGTIEREIGADGELNLVFHDDYNDISYILDRKAYDMLTWHGIGGEYGILKDTPDGTRAEIGYNGEEFTMESIGYIHLLL